MPENSQRQLSAVALVCSLKSSPAESDMGGGDERPKIRQRVLDAELSNTDDEGRPVMVGKSPSSRSSAKVSTRSESSYRGYIPGTRAEVWRKETPKEP